MSNAIEVCGTESQVDVAVVGGGPSGLGVATALRASGVRSVVVLEREVDAGGVPRHCGHLPFGMREFHRCLTGPVYARRLIQRALAAGVKIRTRCTVVRISPSGTLDISEPFGVSRLYAKRVVLCTGVRETPRPARFVSGTRPLGVLTTGAFQAMVYLHEKVPCRRPLIVGTELVSFSSLLTSRHAGVKPVAMLEEGARITAPPYSAALAASLGVPIYRQTRILELIGRERICGVRTVNSKGRERILDCDGVLFTGCFTPESSLLRLGHLEVDPHSGGPVVDQFGRCSDPSFFASGNLLRPVETAGWCWHEGRKAARDVVRSLNGALPSCERSVEIDLRGPSLKFVVPQVLCIDEDANEGRVLQVRFKKAEWGCLSLERVGRTLWHRNFHARPERRILVPIPEGLDDKKLSLSFRPL